MKRLISVVAVAFVATVTAVSAAQADSARITQGDAEALFQAPFNGGAAIRLHGGDVLEGAPVQPGGVLRPFGGGTPHFCTLNWLVIDVALADAMPVDDRRVWRQGTARGEDEHERDDERETLHGAAERTCWLGGSWSAGTNSRSRVTRASAGSTSGAKGTTS